MSTLRTKALLRECIQEILKEDDMGGLSMSDAMVGPYGMHYASQEQLYNIFLKPFKDVVDVAAGKTKELSQKGQTLLNVAFEAVAVALIPILKDSYGEIFDNEKQQIDRIRSEYSDVYNATWDAFKENDILIAAFAYRPDLFLTAQFARKAPKVAAKLASVLSGGKLDRVLSGIMKSGGGGKKGGSEGPGMPFESVMREAEGEESPIEKLFANKKVRAVLANSQKVQQMSKVGVDIVQGTLEQVMQKAQDVLSAKTLQDIQTKTGKKIPGLDKLAQMPQEERQKAEQSLLKGTRDGMKEFYVKQLEAHVKKAIEAGVPKNHPYVSDYVSVISKIKNL